MTYLLSRCRLTAVSRAVRLATSSPTQASVVPMSSYQSELLKDRSVIQIKGAEAPDFLQGLITNDVHHLAQNENSNDNSVLLQRSLYTMFLNTGGRVLYEGILIGTCDSVSDSGGYLLDCDAALADKLLKHLKMYKLRKKVQLKILPDYETWALFDTGQQIEKTAATLAKEFKDLGILQEKGAHCTSDPRVKSLGFRILAPKSLPELCYQLREMDGPQSFSNLRYRVGVPEGGDEVEPGKALPLEYNVEYAHGVSFHKGCYIGQELTARTHHTGVIRKRVMPLTFSQKWENSVRVFTGYPGKPGDSIVNESDRPLGKLICGDRTHGLGLIRIEEAAKSAVIRLKEHPDTTFQTPIEKPFWWPKHSPKKLP